MPTSYEITFLPEGRVVEFDPSRGNYYELDDGSRLDMRITPVWCRRCGGVKEGEDVEPLPKIDQRLAELVDPSSEVYRWMMGYSLSAKNGRGEEFRQKQIRELRRRRQWRENRESPPRCIACGTTDILVLEVDRTVPHPAGTGEIVTRVVGMSSTPWNEWYFTPEGVRVQKPIHAGLRDESYISVWLGSLRTGEELDEYLSDPSGFESDFGFRIDPRHPPQTVVTADGLPVGELLSRLPQSDAFVSPAATLARRMDWDRAASAVVFYGLVYERQYDRSTGDSPLRFVGSWRFLS